MNSTDTLSGNQPFRLDGFTVDPMGRTMTGPQGTVQLEPKVMDVLVVLADNAGSVVPRNEILRRVWPRAVSDEVLSRSIYQLRKHFGEDSRNPRYIVTVPKRGYSLTVQPSPRDSAPSGRTRADRRRLVRPATVVAAAILAAGAVFSYFNSVDRDGSAQSPPSSGSQALAGQGSNPTIAVMPFTNLSESQEDYAYLVDGLAEELLNGLGKLQALNVIARTSSFTFRDTEATTQEIGRDLGVDVLLTGSMLCDGDRIRVVTELIDATDGRQLWTQRYAGNLNDIFDIQDRIARGVAEALDVRLAGDIANLALSRTTQNVRAYALHLEGRYYFNRREPGALRQAIAFFEQAIETDPDFALAHSGLADAHMLRSQYGGLPLDAATARAQGAVDRAIELDPALADAYASQGLIHLRNGRYEEAGEVLREAAALNPVNVLAHLWLGRALDLQYRYRQALAVYRRALLLDPVAPIVNMNMCRMLTLGGHVNEGRGYCAAGLEHEPDFGNLRWALGFNYWLAGDLDAAREHYETAFTAGLADSWAYAEYAELLLDRGEYDAADYWLDRAEALDAPGRAVVFGRSQLFILRDDLEEMRDYGLTRYAEMPGQVLYLLMAGEAEVRRGNHDAAIELYELGRRHPSGQDNLAHIWDVARGSVPALNLAYAYRQQGDQALFEDTLAAVTQAVDDAVSRGIATPAMHYTKAVLHSLRGSTDEAIGELTTGLERGWRGAWRAPKDPNLALLKSDPRFQRVVEPAAARPAAGRRGKRQASVPASVGN